MAGVFENDKRKIIMKLLIVGNRNHQFIYNYIKHLKKYDNTVKVDILSYETFSCKYLNDYLYDNIYYPKVPLFLTKNRYVNYVCRHIKFRKILRQLGRNDYDYVHIHYVEKPIQDNVDLFAEVFEGTIITSVWGSDFFKRSDKNRMKIKKLFLKSEKIAFTSDKFASEFCKFYNTEEITKKICKFKLGLEPLEYLETVERNDHNFNVMIGYNARHNQCHLDILDSISCKSYPRDDLQLLIPLTYPRNDAQYRLAIKNRLLNVGIPYIIYEDFMSDSEVAILRKNTDIFIQLQNTDVMSGAMMEHIAVGSVVITGSWLPYDDLYEMGIQLVTISDRSQIGETLAEVIEKFDYYKSIAQSNSSIILENFKWDYIIPESIKIYDKTNN